MRTVVVAHYLGTVLILLGGTMLLPFGVSVIYQEHDQLAFLTSALVTILTGGTMWFWTRKQPGPMMRRESFLVVALGWALATAFAALPYMLAGTFTSFVDAYFESMGGFTTTGASVLSDIEAQPHGILFWRGFTQWLGGIGIIAIFLASMPMLRIGAVGTSSLYEDEVPGPQADRMTPRLKDTVKVLWLIYLAMTVASILLLLLAGMPLFDSIANTMGSVSSGGYSPRNASIAHYQNPAVDWITIVFMAMSGVNFGLYYLMWKGKFGRAVANTEVRVYLGMLVGFSLLIAIDLIARGHYASFGEAIRFSSFALVSQQTGTGFATADFDLWPWFSKCIILLSMFIGGSSGSTCGGLKVIRLIVVAKYAHRQLYNVFHPRVVLPLKVGGLVIPDNITRESVAFFVLYQSVYLFSTLGLVAMGIDFVTALSGTAATVGIVGPGLGQVGPTLNYGWMPDPAKILLIFNMYVGRLDLWTVLILMRPAFWRES